MPCWRGCVTRSDLTPRRQSGSGKGRSRSSAMSTRTVRGWALLYRAAVSQGGPLAAEITGRIAAIVVRLFLTVAGDDARGTSAALAHAFVGPGESVANWWLEHPEEPREQVAQLLVRLARGALPEARQPTAVRHPIMIGGDARDVRPLLTRLGNTVAKAF
jgi:hypothetical protein